MEIKGVFFHSPVQPGKQMANRQKIAGGVSTAGKETGNIDMIQLSPKAAFQQQIIVAKKEAVSTASAGVPDARINKLKDTYCAGNCPVSGAQVADALMRRLFGEESGSRA